MIANQHRSPARALSGWGRAGLVVALTAGLIGLAPRTASAAPACSPSSTSIGNDTVLTFSNTSTCTWTVPAGVTSADVLVVAGGGGGWADSDQGYRVSSGGGAGGVIYRTGSGNTGFALGSPTVDVTVGTGGGGRTWYNGDGVDGGASTFDSLTAFGGGGGGQQTGRTGGSGGGGGKENGSGSPGGPAAAGGAQGFAGGASVGGYGSPGGGGGGAGGAGSSSGAPGAGVSIAITGISTTYAVGGAAYYGFAYGSMSPAAAYPSIGGGGQADIASAPGQNGANGTVIVRYTSAFAPGAPGTPTTVAGDGEVAVTVTPPSTGGTPDSYDVEAVEDPTKVCSITAPATSCTVTGLTNGTPYTFTSTATNGVGTSGASPPSTAATPMLSVPGTPGAPVAVAGDGQVTVAVTPPGSGGVVSDYTVRVTGDPGRTCTVTVPAMSCVVSPLANNTSYTFEARASNAAGPSSWSPASTAVTPLISLVPLAAPGAVTATAGVASIVADWPSVAQATGYTVTALPGPSTCTTTTTRCVLGAQAGTRYTVTVTATSSGRTSSPSPISNPVTPTAPPVPATPPTGAESTLTTDEGRIGLTAPGRQFTAKGTGFAAGSTVEVISYSTPVTLATTTADGSGAFSADVTMPADLADGSHTLLATGVGPDGTTRSIGLGLTVVPTTSDSIGIGDMPLRTRLPVPDGGSVTLLDGDGQEVTEVTVAGGTYRLDPSSGVITFTRAPGFVGAAAPVVYRVRDGVGTEVTGTRTTVVTAADPTPVAGTPGLKLKKRIVSTVGAAPSASTGCLLVHGVVSRCTVTATGTVDGKRVVLGRGSTRVAASRTLMEVTVPVLLNARGQALVARPGGARLLFSAEVDQRGLDEALTSPTVAATVVAARYALRPVRFASGSTSVRAADARYLAGVRAALGGATSLTCTGHSDNQGPAAASLALSRKRAVAVCAVLSRTLDLSVRIVARGEADPVASNGTAAGRARNRRVDVTVRS
jgi:CshA-type fibril repeat protein